MSRFTFLKRQPIQLPPPPVDAIQRDPNLPACADCGHAKQVEIVLLGLRDSIMLICRAHGPVAMGAGLHS